MADKKEVTLTEEQKKQLSKNKKRQNIVRAFMIIMVLAIVSPMVLQMVQSVQVSKEVQQIKEDLQQGLGSDVQLIQGEDGTIKILPKENEEITEE